MSAHTLGKLRADYLRWHPAQVESGDIDPVYPVLSHLADSWGLDREQRAWLVFTHVVWYHPGSTLLGFEMAAQPTELPDSEEGLWERGLMELPCLTERRGHRPKPPLVNHLLDLRRQLSGGAYTWALQAIEGAADERAAWVQLNEALTTIVGNGRWAAYKTAEMLQKVAGLPVAAADAGHRYSSGPRRGLEILKPESCPSRKDQSPAAVALLDHLTEQWQQRLGEPDIAQVETSLCDFNSLVHGRYYLGHDIDAMQEAFLHPKVRDHIPLEAWEARAEVFEERFLGEYQGRLGVQKEANKHYAKTGELLYV